MKKAKKVARVKKAVAAKKATKPVKKAKMDFPPISAEELLTAACEFDMGPEPILNGLFNWHEMYPKEARQHHVYIRNMGNPEGEGPDRWGIFRDGHSVCMNKDGEWVWQSMPSSRTEDFYDKCRYDSVHEAIGYYRKWKAAISQWATEKIKAGDGVKSQRNGQVILNYEDCPNIPKFK